MCSISLCNIWRLRKIDCVVATAFFPLAFKTVLRIGRTRGARWRADMPKNWGIDEATVTVAVQHDKTKKIAIAISKISLVCCIHFCQLKDLDDFVADAIVVERCGALRVLGRIFFCKCVCVCVWLSLSF